MEPGLGGQEKAHHLSGDDQVLSVAMEPGLGGQEKVSFTKDGLLEPTTSQWSLALAARKRSLEVSLKLLSYIVAMEPGLGGQEKLGEPCEFLIMSLSQWSLALAARKRARDFLLV